MSWTLAEYEVRSRRAGFIRVAPGRCPELGRGLRSAGAFATPHRTAHESWHQLG